MPTIRFSIAVIYPEATRIDEVIGVFEAAMDDIQERHPDWIMPAETNIS